MLNYGLNNKNNTLLEVNKNGVEFPNIKPKLKGGVK